MPKSIETLSGADAAAFQGAIAPHVEAVAQPFADAAEAAADTAIVKAGEASTAASTATAVAAAILGDARSPNLFAAGSVTPGYECYGNGQLSEEGNSFVSANIPVFMARSVAITGLGANAGFARYVHFLAANGVTPILVTTIPDGINSKIFNVPIGAHYMRFSPRQRIVGSNDFSGIEVRTGRVIAIFGDSITETENVDAGTYIYGSGHRANWPDYVIPRMLPLAVYNFAKSGAHYADVAGLTANQTFSQQVTNAEATGVPFDTIIVGNGTNDLGNSNNPGSGSVVLGTAAAALAKDYGSLDPTISMDGMRKGLQRLRNSFPISTSHVLTPIQRGDFTHSQMRPWVEDIKLMSGAMGAEVIDQFNESGIVHFFETVSGSGIDLLDRLHPRASGMVKQAELILSHVQRRRVGAI